MSELNYEEDIRISEHNLDKEWLDQPRRYMVYSRELANARDRLARADRNYDVVVAEAYDRCKRKLLEAAKDDKKGPTVDAIKSAVAVDDAVKAAFEETLKLKHEVDILQAAVTAFDHRKRALENLVTLHGQQYFAGPRVPLDIGREFVQQTRELGKTAARDRTAERTGRTR